jgi:hypothetical protein
MIPTIPRRAKGSVHRLDEVIEALLPQQRSLGPDDPGIL